MCIFTAYVTKVHTEVDYDETPFMKCQITFYDTEVGNKLIEAEVRMRERNFN